MVNYDDTRLDGIFAALADPTRRALLARLAQAPELAVTALAEPFDMSLPGVLKHLDVLTAAGLIDRTKSGRTVSCRLNAAPMQEAARWLARYEQFWTARLDALERYLDQHRSPADATQSGSMPPRPQPQSIPRQIHREQAEWPPQPPSNPASPSNAGSAARRKNASAPGPTRKR